MKTRKHDTHWMVGVAMMAAIVVLLANTPLGMIQLPIIKATTTHIPVILGAILLGPLAGTILGIKPVMHVDDEGRLVAVGKRRGRKASMEALADQLAETVIRPEEQTIFISHGDCLDEARQLEQMIRSRTPIKDCYINPVGPVIGAHSGPGTLALFFYGTHR